MWFYQLPHAHAMQKIKWMALTMWARTASLFNSITLLLRAVVAPVAPVTTARARFAWWMQTVCALSLCANHREVDRVGTRTPTRLNYVRNFTPNSDSKFNCSLCLRGRRDRFRRTANIDEDYRGCGADQQWCQYANRLWKWHNWRM